MLANRVCSVSKSESFANDGLIYDMRQPFVSSCRFENECIMEANETRASAVVINVRAEMDQGLRSLDRRAFGRGSGILPDGMSSFEDTIKTEVSED